MERVPGAGKTCVRPRQDEIPPKECVKQPQNSGPGLDSVPVVGGGLQQGASTAQASGGQASSGSGTTVPAGQPAGQIPQSPPGPAATPPVSGGQGGSAPGAASIPVVGPGIDSAASGNNPQAQAPPTG